MRFRVLTVIFFVFLFSCVAKESTPAGMEDDLKNAMQTYLYSVINNDSSNVKYHVEKVIYYDDNVKQKYICEFTVHMRERTFDTTGIMKAYISKDLKKVERIY